MNSYPRISFDNLREKIGYSNGHSETKNWVLSFNNFEAKTEGLRETLCALGNGVFATRGACEMSRADENHYPGTYFNCYFNREESKIGNKIITNEDLVNFPNWLPITFRVGDSPTENMKNSQKLEWISLSNAKNIEFYEQNLHLNEGILQRSMKLTDSYQNV